MGHASTEGLAARPARISRAPGLSRSACCEPRENLCSIRLRDSVSKAGHLPPVDCLTKSAPHPTSRLEHEVRPLLVSIVCPCSSERRSHGLVPRKCMTGASGGHHTARGISIGNVLDRPNPVYCGKTFDAASCLPESTQRCQSRRQEFFSWTLACKQRRDRPLAVLWHWSRHTWLI